jgi:hypothetical protein
MLLANGTSTRANNTLFYGLPEGAPVYPNGLPREETHVQLGGAYIGNGWEYGSIYIFCLTSISNQIDDFFTMLILQDNNKSALASTV